MTQRKFLMTSSLSTLKITVHILSKLNKYNKKKRTPENINIKSTIFIYLILDMGFMIKK